METEERQKRIKRTKKKEDTEIERKEGRRKSGSRNIARKTKY